MRRAATLVFLLVPVQFAQGPPVAISAPKPVLVVGETMALSATVRSGNGAVVPNAAVSWGSNNPNLIRVDGQGNATATGVGMCGVFAQSGSARANLQLQCIPSRIDLQPASKELSIGEQLQFNARALDYNGEPIPNVTFTWQVTGANGGQINAARIDGNGLFTAVGTGVITVRARLNFSNAPGRIESIWGLSTVRIEPQKFYRVRRLIGSDEVRHSFILRAAGRNSAVNENGQAAFIASLDGLATALLLYDRANASVIAQGGTPLLSGMTGPPDSVALNNRGEVLTRFSILPGSEALTLYTGDGPQYLVFGGQSFGDIENLRGFRIYRWSLNDYAEAVFSSGFTKASQAYNGLFRVVNRRVEMLVSSETELPGIAAGWSPVEFGIDNDGVVYFVASRPRSNDVPQQGLFRIPGPGRIERLITEAEVPGLRSIRSLAISKDGGAASIADLRSGGQQLIRIKGSQRVTLESGGLGSIYQVSDAAGVLLNYCASAGCGLFQWKDDRLSLLVRNGSLAANGEPIMRFDAAGLGSTGRLTAIVGTAENELVLIEPGAAQQVLVQAGDRLDVTANLQLLPNSTLLRGAAGGRLHLTIANSVFEYDNGTLLPRLMTGDRLPDGGVFNGGVLGHPSGDVYFQSQTTAYRLRNEQIETVAQSGVRLPDGSTVENIGIRDTNSRGVIAVRANIRSGSNPVQQDGLFVFEGGQATEIVRSGVTVVDGLRITGVNQVYVDDQSRVVFQPQFEGRPFFGGYYIWSNGRMDLLAADGRNQFGSMGVANFGIRGARGSKFYGFGFQPGGGDQAIFDHAGSGWQLVVSNNDRMPDGSAGGFGIGTWDANARGDVAFVSQSGSPLALNVRTAEGELRQVQSLLTTTAEGDQITRIQEIDLRNDGRIYFAGFDSLGRYSIYAAEPIQ